jgi:hypothetical protein
MAEHVRTLKKNARGTLTGVWVPHHTRNQIVDYVQVLLGQRNRDQRRAVHRVARHRRLQVLRLAGTLRQGERAQRLGSPCGFWLGAQASSSRWHNISTGTLAQLL